MTALKLKIFMGISIFFMLLALLTGIFRLMSENSLQTGVLSNFYALHPIIMVFGFLGCIVMAERVAGVSVVPGLSKSKIIPIMVPLMALGVLSEIVGYTEGEGLFRIVGGSLLTLSCIFFAIVLLQLAKHTGIKLPFYFMILSVVSLAGAAVLSSFLLPAGEPAYIMLLLTFPILFIFGERVELTRFTSTKQSALKFKTAFIFSISSISSFIFGSFFLSSYQTDVWFVSYGFVALLVTLVSVLSAEVRNFANLTATKLPLHRYVSIHTQVAYGWGIVGVIAALFYFLGPWHLDLYDAFIHALAVGFIGTMLLAHGPVIMPSVTGRKLQSTSISFAPLLLLTLANLIRVAGDVILNFFYSEPVSIVIGLSGWLILASVLIFLREILLKTRKRNSNLTPRADNFGVGRREKSPTILDDPKEFS